MKRFLLAILALLPLTASAASPQMVSTVAVLRAANFGSYSTINLSGYNTAIDNGGGVLVLNSADTTSSDNGCTIFVDAANHRFYRAGGQASLNIDQCGAIGSGVVDDTARINAALSASKQVVCTAGKTYEVMGLLSPVANSTVDFAGCIIAINETGSAANAFMNIAVNGVTVRNVHAIRTFVSGGTGGGAGIQVGITASANNTLIDNFYCDSSALATELAECIRYGSGANLTINNFHAKSTGYGILQNSSGVFTDLKVTNAIAEDMYSDFLEQNASGGRTTNLTVDNLQFQGCHNFPTPETECRGIGVVSTFNFTLSNSTIYQASGDACVHLEGASTHIKIIGSTFWDCQVSGGNDGFIYVLTSSANLNLTGNTFIVDNAYTCSGCYALGNGAAAYANAITATGNTIIDLQSAHQIGGFDLSGYVGNADIVGNTMQGGSTFALLFSSGTASTEINISSNNVVASTNGVYSANVFVATGAGGTNVDVKGNTFSVSGYSVLSGPNTNSTLPPTNWTVTGNKSLGAGLGTLLFSAINSSGGLNWYASGLTNHTIATTPGTGTNECYDTLQGTGVIHKCP